jgi:NitT/TauT family transport system substrate-binding protein
MLRRGAFVAGAILIALMFILGGSGQAQTKQKIKMGFLVSDQLHQYIIPIGIEKGYFAAEGLEVDKKEYAAAGILMQGFAANEMDVGIVGVSGAMIAKANGTDVVIIGTQNLGGSCLVVDPNIHSFEDLKDQPVANPGIGSNHHTLLMLLEKKYNVTVKKATMKPTDMPIFASNKEIKGAIAYEPHPTRIAKMAGFKRLFTSNQILKDHQCCVLVVHSKMIKEHKDIVQKLTRVNARATKFIREHKAEALPIIAKYSGVPIDILDTAYDNMIYPWPPRVNAQTSKILLQGIVDTGKIPKEALTPNMDAWWSKLYDSSFEEEQIKSGYLNTL